MAIVAEFIFIAVSIRVSKTIGSLQQGALYRNQHIHAYNGNFQADHYHHLSITKITSCFVMDKFDCMFKCIGEPKCYSFNMAAYPDSKGLYLCELLATDKYRATKKFHANATFHHYSPWSPCQSEPCQNNRDCVPHFEQNSYHCDCQPGFAGNNCERKGKCCSDIKSHSSRAINGSYVIDPDGEGGYEPFTVYCDMTDKNEVGVTVLSHDSEDRLLVNGFRSRGKYVRDVHYTGEGVTNVPQIAGLTVVSAHCEQFIKYECYGSVLLYNGNAYGWWVSRDNVAMMYWGGATPANSYKCACGLDNTCVDPSDGCNCDKNDNVWREDSGFLTEKSHLPVLQLKFGDTDAFNEKGYHTLGKLKCYGIV